MARRAPEGVRPRQLAVRRVVLHARAIGKATGAGPPANTAVNGAPEASSVRSRPAAAVHAECAASGRVAADPPSRRLPWAH